MKKKRPLLILALVVVAGAVAVALSLRRSRLVLTGMVTTDEVIVSSEISGRLQQLACKPGDVVKQGQLLGTISPAEWKADLAYFDSVGRSAAAQVTQARAELSFQQELTSHQVTQAEANRAAAEAAVKQAAADLEIAKLNFDRAEGLRQRGVNSQQEFDLARTGRDSAAARVAALQKQATAAGAAVDLAKAGSAQVAARQATLTSSQQQLAAAEAQKEKAGVRVGYTELRAPVDGVVNVRAALAGEVVAAGQPIVTLIDPSNLWVRIDVEESYIDRLHLGDKLSVRFPSGAEREGTIFFRGVDADYATQRDVSRTKRDIKTFELRLRCDNRDQSLAVGLTAYVTLPLTH